MKHKLIKYIFIFIVIYLLHICCLYYLSNTIKNKYDEKLFLFDNIHEIIPEIDEKGISDYMATFFMIIALYFVIRKGELDKFIIIISLIFLIKAISCSITLLPVPKGYKNHVKCNEKFKFNHILYGKCGDLMFSGHIATFLVFILFLIRYGLNKIIGGIIIAIFSIIVLLKKEHYSIDIFMAYFVVFFAYSVGIKYF